MNLDGSELQMAIIHHPVDEIHTLPVYSPFRYNFFGSLFDSQQVYYQIGWITFLNCLMEVAFFVSCASLSHGQNTKKMQLMFLEENRKHMVKNSNVYLSVCVCVCIVHFHFVLITYAMDTFQFVFISLQYFCGISSLSSSSYSDFNISTNGVPLCEYKSWNIVHINAYLTNATCVVFFSFVTIAIIQRNAVFILPF